MRHTIIPTILTCAILAAMAHADLKDGLVAHFPFDEGQGTAATDTSGHGLKGAITGARWIERGEERALEFDGKSAYVDCGPGAALGLKEQLTLSLWVLPQQGQTAEPMLVGEHPDNYALTYYYKNNRVYFYVAGAGNALSTPVALGSTSHVAGTYDGKTMRLYVNGKLRQTREFGESAVVPSQKYLVIGKAAGGHFLKGIIDDVRIHNRALSAAEVRQLAAAHTPNYLAQSERFELAELPDTPQKRDRHTLFLANFDREESNDADYARFDALCGAGVGSKKVPGASGTAVALAGELYHYGPLRYAMGHLIYNGLANVNMKRGTLEFRIRSTGGKNIWRDGARHDLVHVLITRSPEYAGRPHFELQLAKTETGLLQLSAARPIRNTEPVPVEGVPDPPAGQGVIALRAADLAPAEWHHVLVAWDVKDGGRLWLAVDGKGVTSAFGVPVGPGRPRPAIQIRIGGKNGGEMIDDLKITGTSVTQRISGAQPANVAGIDLERLIREEDAVRRWLDLMIRLQTTHGGWYENFDVRSWRPAGLVPPNTIKSSDFFSPGQVASVFLRAYEMFDDERYLSVAKKTAQFFLNVQHADGHFDAYFYDTSLGIVPHVLPYAAIEETKQHAPLWFLAHLHAVTGHERYLDAAKRAADFLIEAQNADGSWPWGYQLKQKKADGYHATFNDYAIGWSAQNMVFMYQLTGEKKYLDSFFRCVEWVIKAQLPAPTYGWAEQYNERSAPCWGRHFEPPALAGESTRDAILLLQLAYDMTSNRRYLEPIKKYWDWAKTVKPTEHGFYHDIKTGTRMAALHNKVYFLGTKEWDAVYKDLLVWRGWEGPVVPKFLKKNDGLRKNGPAFRFTLTRRWHPRAKFAELTPTRDQLVRFAKTYQGYKARKGFIDKSLETNEKVGTGAWNAGGRNRHGEEYFSALTYKWTHIFLHRILAARIALGDIPVDRFPMVDPETEDGVYRFFWVDPARDWYAIENKADLPAAAP